MIGRKTDSNLTNSMQDPIEQTKPKFWLRWRRRAAGWWTAVRPLWPIPAVLAAAFFAAFLYDTLFPPPTPLSPADVEGSIAAAMASATPPPPYSAEVYQIILPSLVFIQTQQEGEEGSGVGSGVVIDAAGQILTSLHVVEGADEINLIFADGSRGTAVLANSDPANDIAVLQPLTPPDLIVPAVLAGTAGLRVGDEAYAVGNPLGLAGSMSAGVISGFNRSLPIDETGQQLEGLIQFDAAVNPGNSGGPLLNRDGQVVGIVTALANPNAQNSFTGIGFAVPISIASQAAGSPPY
jgi:S1-C subfamily serine protease